jgi:hypothetical protein
MTAISRPAPTEYAPYYGRYIDLVPEGDILTFLSGQIHKTLSLVGSVGEDKADFRYAPGKWSIREVVGHVIDTERVFAFRAFAFSRNDRNALPGMDQEEYARGANHGERRLSAILDEYRSVRGATIALVGSFSEEMLMRTGTASGFGFTVRSLAYIIAGHEQHHLRVLRERYLPAL